ncbi:hypothetical protein IH979_02620, partial [Patescibacteria group bacterium]|nr:hypothetical protein [Patescibacteria group bacterium]
MPAIEYPYLPEGRTFKYVPNDHPFMQEARRARETLSGDPLFPVGIVMVKDGEIVARAGNGFNRGRQVPHVCPRIVLECPSGTGYELCDVHDPPGHSEPMVVQAAKEAAIDAKGSDVYMYGHWWACEPCWQTLIDTGIRDFYLVDDAHERFSRDQVYAETLKPTVKSAYISGGLTNLPEDRRDNHKAFYEQLGAACEEMGCA